jgi:hypothetical protein
MISATRFIIKYDRIIRTFLCRVRGQGVKPYERLPSIPGNVPRTALAGPKEVAIKQAKRWAFLSVLSVSGGDGGGGELIKI